MTVYDVIVVGGGIGGSIAARLAAEKGFNTLLIERAKTPRDKPCSGIQFMYFEKIIGAKIPADKLCKNEIYRIEILTPDDQTYNGQMKMLNFWRSTFDSWLNDLAVYAGADFRDQTRLIDFQQTKDVINCTIQSRSISYELRTKYLIAADGMSSRVRKNLHPQDYTRKAPGGAMNYYCEGKGDLNPNTLYMINKKEFAPIMFAWIYKKDDLWVIGTGAERDLKGYSDRFFEYVCEKYNFRGKIVQKEGFASPLIGGVYLGEDNVLLCGDGAGLMDAYRGVAMDNAALSARFAVQAVIKAEKSSEPAIHFYRQKMGPMKQQLESNEKKRERKFASNESLTFHLSPHRMLLDGLKMLAANSLNKLMPPDKVITLPF